jgi:hypothetical protein
MTRPSDDHSPASAKAGEKPSQPKKRYSAPALQVYGGIQELTLLVGNATTTDGGSGSFKKTT